MDSIKDVMTGLMQKSLDRIEVNKEDYKKDGLLFCGKCNEPKQMRIRLFDEDKIVGISCECMKKRDKAEKEAEARFKESQRIEMNKRQSGLNSEQLMKTFDNAICNQNNAVQMKYCKNYVSKFQEMLDRSQGLLMYGPPGTGKSYLASCIANELLRNGRVVKVTSTISVVGRTAFFKENEFEEYINEITKPELLIVDDLGAERNTDFALERVHDLIEYRTNCGRPLIVTTNYSLEQMKNETDIRKARTFDRLFSCCFPMPFTGNSFRKQRANNSYSEIKKLLEG